MKKGKKEIIDRQDIIDDGNGPEKKKKKISGRQGFNHGKSSCGRYISF